jgi:hypothetical protein
MTYVTAAYTPLYDIDKDPPRTERFTWSVRVRAGFGGALFLKDCGNLLPLYLPRNGKSGNKLPQSLENQEIGSTILPLTPTCITASWGVLSCLV